MKLSQEIFIKRLQEKFAGQLPAGIRVWLYGSRARGEQTENSDWDILVLLDKDFATEEDFNNFGFPLCLFGSEYDEFVVPIVFGKNQWKKLQFTPFYENVIKDKIEII